METWKGASQSDRKRYAVIAGALERQPALLRLLFRADRPELSSPPEEISSHVGAFSSGEKILVRVALDIWSGSGDVLLMDLCRLDPQNFRNAITAFIKMQSL